MQLWPFRFLKKNKKSNFNEYHFEPFTETLKHYRAYKRVMFLSREGINNKFLIPKVKVSSIKKDNVILHVSRLNKAQKCVDLLMQIWKKPYGQLKD